MPKALEAICLRAIAKRPDDRYATAAELGHEIERWLDDLPVQSYPEPFSLRMKRWIRGHQALVATSSAIVLMSTLGLGLFSVVMSRNNAELDAANQREIAERTKAVEQEQIALEQKWKAVEQEQIAIEQKKVAEHAKEEEYRARQLELVMREKAEQSLAEQIEQAKQASRGLFDYSTLEYLANHNASSVDKLERAVRLRSDDDPLKALYMNVLADRISQGGRLLTKLHHNGNVRAAVFSPDGTRIATASHDYTARLWNARTGTQIGEPMRHGKLVSAVAYSPDGTRIATASQDNTARVWDAQTGKPIGEPMRHDGFVISVIFSADGTRIATGSQDETARLWDAQTGMQLGEPMRHENRVFSIAFSPDDTQLATASDDMTARIWDIESIVAKNPSAYINHFAKQRDPSIPIDAETQAELDALQAKRDLRYRKLTVAKAVAEENTFVALYHLPWLIEHEPDQVQWKVLLARTNTLQNIERLEWTQAVESILQAIKIEPSAIDYQTKLLCSLGADDGQLIRQAIEEYLTFAEASRESWVWDDVGHTANLWHDQTVPWDRIHSLATKAVESNRKSVAYQETLGATLYRMGQFDDALVALNRSIEIAKETREAKTAAAKPTENVASAPKDGSYYGHAFLAMVLHQLNEPEKSNAAWKMMERFQSEAPALNWHVRLRRKLLDAEVRQTCGLK